MAPDFARLLPGIGREYSHSIQGMFLVDIPLGIVLAGFASWILIPRAARLPGLGGLARPAGDRILWHWLALATLIGCATHLGWDYFTHGDHKVFHAAILDRQIAQTVAGPFRVRQLAWAVNTLAGIAALVVAGLVHLHRSKTPLRSFFAPSWLRMGVVALTPLLVLPMEHPVRLDSLMNDLAMLLNSNRPMVRIAILVSGIGLAALFLFETRKRKTSPSDS